MERLTLADTNAAPSLLGEAPGVPTRIVGVSDRTPTPFPLDDLRELAVVVWARIHLVERLLGASCLQDPRLRAGLAEIDAALTAIGVRLDALEDTIPTAAD